MHGCKVQDETRMLGEPLADFFPVMGADIVALEMNGADTLVNLRLQRFQKGDAFPLTLPLITLAIDLARPGVKSRKEIKGPSAFVLMLAPGGHILGLGRLGRMLTRSRLQGGLLVHGQDQFIWTQRPRVEGNQFRHGRIEGSVPRLLGIEPDMLAPGFELMCRQNPADGGSRDVRHYALRDELARQFGAIPLGEATTQQIRPFAGQAHDVDRHLWGKNRPWLRGQGRRRGHPDAGRESAWPSGAPRSVARPPPAPPRIGKTQLPAGG